MTFYTVPAAIFGLCRGGALFGHGRGVHMRPRSRRFVGEMAIRASRRARMFSCCEKEPAAGCKKQFDKDMECRSVDSLLSALFGNTPSGFHRTYLRGNNVHIAAVEQVNSATSSSCNWCTITDWGTADPASDAGRSLDLFLLNMMRAASDIVIQTGKNVRCEPGLRIDLHSQRPAYQSWNSSLLPWSSLRKWRNSLNNSLSNACENPQTVVLSHAHTVGHNANSNNRAGCLCTASDDLVKKMKNPAFFSVTPPPLLFSPSKQASAGTVSEPITQALSHVRDVYGNQTVVIEAGPSTTMPLYSNSIPTSEVCIDVLLISVRQSFEKERQTRPDDYEAAQHSWRDDVFHHFDLKAKSSLISSTSASGWTFYLFERKETKTEA